MPDIKDTPSAQTGAMSRRTLALIAVVVFAFICLLAAGSFGTWAFAILKPTSTPGIGSTQVYTDTMVGLYVPAGNFLMGLSDADLAEFEKTCPDCDFNELKPQHTVYLDAYWIDQTDVTNAMFAKFVAATSYRTDADIAGSSLVYHAIVDDWFDTYGANWQHPRGPESNINGLDNYPVVQMSWNDANAYCEWAGRYLPTEAQWEKAARGTDGRKYPWGNLAPDPTLLNFNGQFGDTTEVGRYPAGASPYGAFDMLGNAGQWVADWYDRQYYANSPDRNPTGPMSGRWRVQRGGPLMRIAAARNWLDPGVRYDVDGFRCARSP